MTSDFAQACVMAVLATAALLGNIVICLVVYKHSWVLHPTNDFVISLALLDILMVVIPVPLTIGAMIMDSAQFYSDTTCSIYGVFNDFPKMASIFTLAFVAIQRYYRIVKPQEYEKTFTPGYSVIILMIIWIVSGLSSGFPVMVSWAEYKFHSEYLGCYVTFKWDLQRSIWNVSFLFVGIVIPAFLTFNCYRIIFRIIRGRKCEVDPRVNARQRFTSKMYRLTKTFLIVSIASITCSCPAAILLVVDQLFSLHITLIAARIAFFSNVVASASKVFIYCLVNRPFRRELRNLINFIF